MGAKDRASEQPNNHAAKPTPPDVEQLRWVLDRIPIGAAILDAEGQLLYANSPLCAMLGYTLDELRNRTFFEITHPDDYGKTYEAAHRLWDLGEQSTQYEKRYIRQDGSILWVNVTLKAVRDAEGNLLYALDFETEIPRDPLRVDDDVLNELHAQRRTVAELETTLQDLVYLISHDLREPARTARSYLQLIEHKAGSWMNEELRELFQTAQEASSRMLVYLQGLLEFSRVATRGEPLCPVALEVELQHVLRQLRSRIDALNAQVSYERLPMVLGDPRQLRTVLRELLTNALWFNDRRPEIRLWSKEQEKLILIAVQDNGIGIPKDQREEVFRLFRTAHPDRPRPGPGMGLPLVQRIMRRHRGQIWFESREREGTTFFLAFPHPALYPAGLL